MNSIITGRETNNNIVTASHKKNKKHFLLIAGGMLFIASLSACNDKKTEAGADQSQQLKQQMDSVSAANNNMQTQYNAVKVQVDQLTSQKASLDSQVAQKNTEIAKLKGQIHSEHRKNRKLAAELKKAKKEIASLNESVKSYLERIGVLEKQSSDMEQEKNSWVSKYNSLKDLGSVLHASNIRLETIHLKHHGKKEKDTKRARKADVLRIHFDIDENRIADNGTKDLYFVIKGPDGNLLRNANSSSFNVAGGQSMTYSAEKEVSLTTGEPIKNLSVDWKNGDFKKGTYNIDIYNSGYKIGGAKVTLR